MKTDETLMAEYVAGDDAAFRALFERYSGRLFAFFQRDVRSADECRDLLQLTFLHFHRARADFRAGEPVRPWIYTIAVNLKRELFRKRGRKKERGLAEGEIDSIPDDAPAPPDPERAARVRAALLALPAGQREVIELHWFEDLAFAEVARIVGATETAVKVRAHRGYERLRELLADEAEPPRNQPAGSAVPPSAPPGASPR